MREIPVLGIGLGHREPMHRFIIDHADEIDWLEIYTDRFVLLAQPGNARRLSGLRQRFPLVPHGMELSIGSEGPLDATYVERVAALVRHLDAPWFSDHLCFTRDGGVQLGHMAPVHRTHEAALEVARRAQHVQQLAGRPFILENITYYIDVPAKLSEAEFLGLVFANCDAGILLDLPDLLINATNHGFDPMGFLDAIPLDRVVQVHLAGTGEDDGSGFLRDTQAGRVDEQVWEMLRYVARRAPLRGVMIERDACFPATGAEFEHEILADLRIARTVMAGSAR